MLQWHRSLPTANQVQGRFHQHPQLYGHTSWVSNSPSTTATLAGSIRDTISARSVKEALGQVRTCRVEVEDTSRQRQCSLCPLPAAPAHRPLSTSGTLAEDPCAEVGKLGRVLSRPPLRPPSSPERWRGDPGTDARRLSPGPMTGAAA